MLCNGPPPSDPGPPPPIRTRTWKRKAHRFAEYYMSLLVPWHWSADQNRIAFEDDMPFPWDGLCRWAQSGWEIVRAATFLDSNDHTPEGRLCRHRACIHLGRVQVMENASRALIRDPNQRGLFIRWQGAGLTALTGLRTLL